MKEHKLRIMFSSNAPFSTSGYGSQMHHLLPALQKLGWNNLAQICFYGLEGGVVDVDGVKLYPRIGSVWGDDALIEHSRDFKADIVIPFQDMWVLNPQLLAQVKNLIPYVPIDHDPVPQAVVERLKGSFRILTHSLFGKKQLQKKGMFSTLIPLTVDTDVFEPLDKMEARKRLNIPQDIFLFGMVAANKDNPPRKSFQEAMDAFKLFHDKNPKSAIYFHVQVNQNGGFPIVEYARELGIADAVYHLQGYDILYKVNRHGMAQIYSMLDCLLMPSTNEGFGVPAIEAQACGVPVIVNNFTSMPELVVEGKTGEICDIAYKRFSPLMSYVGIPSVSSLVEKMEKIAAGNAVEYAKAARKHALDNYSLYAAMPLWDKFLTKVEEELYPETVDTPVEKK